MVPPCGRGSTLEGDSLVEELRPALDDNRVANDDLALPQLLDKAADRENPDSLGGELPNEVGLQEILVEGHEDVRLAQPSRLQEHVVLGVAATLGASGDTNERAVLREEQPERQYVGGVKPKPRAQQDLHRLMEDGTTQDDVDVPLHASIEQEARAGGGLAGAKGSHPDRGIEDGPHYTSAGLSAWRAERTTSAIS